MHLAQLQNNKASFLAGGALGLLVGASMTVGAAFAASALSTTLVWPSLVYGAAGALLFFGTLLQEELLDRRKSFNRGIDEGTKKVTGTGMIICVLGVLFPGIVTTGLQKIASNIPAVLF